MKPHFKKDRTFVIIKPDGIQRSLIGEIIKRYERPGLKLVGVKMLIPTAEKIRKHYTVDSGWLRKVGEKNIKSYELKGKKAPINDPVKMGEKVLEVLIKYMTSGPVIAMVWQGAHAVQIVKKITGSTEPLTSAVGTIRGDFVLDSYEMSDTDARAVRNVLHVSTSQEEAEAEINIWFDKKELINYCLVQEAILYDVNLDGIIE